MASNVLPFPREARSARQYSPAALVLAGLLIICRSLAWSATAILAGAGFWWLVGA